MGALHVNGQKATGVNITLSEGVFMDANNLIFSYTINSGSISQTEYSYTATEDCYVRFMTCTPGADQMTKIFIDGVEIFRIQNTGIDEIFSNSCLLKKGQVITLSNIGKYTGIGVYGIQHGTIEGKLQPVIYSLEEREVGVWTDGKPLYQKTIEIPSVSFDDQWHDIAHNISNIDTVVSCTGILFGEDGEFFNLPQYRASTQQGFTFGIQGSSSEYIGYVNNWYDSPDMIYATLLYTKTTDTPGSGTWTPDGAYAHHYSTDEHLVGTYEGETLYERNIDITLADSSDMQTFAPGTLGIGPIKVIIDAYFKNSGGQQLRMSRWYGNDYWSYIAGSNGGIMIKRNTSDPNWTTGVHFVATVQYTKSSS